MEDAFTSGQLFLFFLRGVLTAVMPFAAAFYMRKKYGSSLYPVIVGFVSLMLLSFPRQLIRGIFVQGSDSFAAKFLFSVIVGAIFEECGRYAAMRLAMPNHDRTADAVCYGIGHGGLELLMTSVRQFGIFADALGQDGTQEHLAAISEQGLLTFLEITIGSTGTLAFHIAMSVLILRAVHYENSRKLIPIAIFCHVLTNYVNLCFGTIADTLLTVLICVFVYYQGRQYQNESEMW